MGELVVGVRGGVVRSGGVAGFLVRGAVRCSSCGGRFNAVGGADADAAAADADADADADPADISANAAANAADVAAVGARRCCGVFDFKVLTDCERSRTWALFVADGCRSRVRVAEEGDRDI